MTDPIPTSPQSTSNGVDPVDNVELAYRWIRDRILTGQLRPGSVVSQVRLAQELKISRTPLREALRQLTAEGLIISDFNRRIRISELDLTDFDEIYAMRLALEPIGISTTVPSLTAEQKGQLRQHVAMMDVAIEKRDLDLLRVHHKGFHLGLVQQAGKRLNRTVSELWDHSERYRLAYMHLDERDPNDALIYERFRISQDEHEQILAAALAGESALCSHRLVGHLQRTVDVVYQEATRAREPFLSHHVLNTLHGQEAGI
jgi:DNA-binding GntR family transcriptional regulator